MPNARSAPGANNRSRKKGSKQNRKTKNVNISKKKRALKASKCQGWKVGMSAMLHFWRDPEFKFCYICGEDNHDEFFCPFNYLYGIHGSRTCNVRCAPGEHLMVSSTHHEFLRCFVRVSNLPPNFRQWHLGDLCKAFGPLRMWHVPMINDEVCRSFGFAIFRSREHAENAIERLNGECFGGYKVRFDWAYPCI
ncbi:uncharacterized protein LOC133903924 isoform X2 [Phragmites australis]|uniref:uncharacterized protein LOC133903924 isoform X2 n=1 Tax=Phragmites australis TaxID=29695 RepID=UPI002D78F729|nr:uncharacterized protein LOC133903924 isoform X2 [Phragmites australis]